LSSSSPCVSCAIAMISILWISQNLPMLVIYPQVRQHENE
jgi:hypothetical protein